MNKLFYEYQNQEYPQWFQPKKPSHKRYFYYVLVLVILLAIIYLPGFFENIEGDEAI